MFEQIKQWFSISRSNTSHSRKQDLGDTDLIFQKLVDERRVPGLAVSIFKKDGIIFQKGYGLADIENKVAVDPAQTLFRIASVSKCITGLALGKMMEEGFIDLDKSIYHYVPYYPKKRHDFTLRQLASHTAGFRGYRGKEFALNKDLSIKDSIQLFDNDPLLFEPAKGYLYNSFDFVLLSLAMQEVSKMPFEDYVMQHILQPLNMQNTFVPSKNGVDSHLIEKQAGFYTKRTDGFRKALPVNNFFKFAGGGILSTSADLVLLGKEVVDQKLLKTTTYEQLLSPSYVSGKSTYYGLGFQVSQDFKGRSFVGHVGNSVGAYSNFFVYPDADLVVSILINCTDPKVQKDLDMAIDTLF